MTEANSIKIGAILLAAGGSHRFGSPKQLIDLHGTPLIRRTAEMLLASICSPVVAVLGAEIETTSAALKGIDISVVVNDDWQLGMSTSIRSGINNILAIEPDLDAVVIALCDQPLIQTDDIDRIVVEFTSSGKPIVASRYADTIGVPALFERSMFDQLLLLEGDQGARKLIRSHAGLTAAVEIQSAQIDIDVPDDLIKIS